MHDIIIKEIINNKREFMDLLLIGDEQEELILRYIDAGRLFVGFYENEPIACCVTTEENYNLVEIRNLAVLANYRQRGIGKKMLDFAESKYPGRSFILGTGENPATIRFYRNCGYTYSHRSPNHFINNYDHPIYENGVQLKDMVHLKKIKDLPTMV